MLHNNSDTSQHLSTHNIVKIFEARPLTTCAKFPATVRTISLSFVCREPQECDSHSQKLTLGTYGMPDEIMRIRNVSIEKGSNQSSNHVIM